MNDVNDETDGRTDLASDDADYILLGRQTGLQGSSQPQPSNIGGRRKSKSRRRHKSQADESQTASFVSTTSHSTAHPMAPQQLGVVEASSISPEWQMLRHNKSDQHAVPPSSLYAHDHMWRHSMSMPMSGTPFPEHGLISPPPHHMNAGGLPVAGVGMHDPRYINGSYCHPPMHSGPQYIRHPEYAQPHDPRCMPIRPASPQDMYIGRPTPPLHTGMEQGYY